MGSAIGRFAGGVRSTPADTATIAVSSVTPLFPPVSNGDECDSTYHRRCTRASGDDACSVIVPHIAGITHTSGFSSPVAGVALWDVSLRWRHGGVPAADVAVARLERFGRGCGDAACYAAVG